ncbi:GNAT family N-acetyltransferase [Apibacter raozihei]|uniref:GNAT family N-acetyltransferase n=1 Tax=Apibacter raozihei TaxID=2500547 RepID=UPI000FE33CA1|nr:GNAT family N-acetyltransferase [Apibacter raozihei]
MEIINATQEHYSIIKDIAYKTWPDTFGQILSKDQIDYMLSMMYSIEAMKNQITELNHKYFLIAEKGIFFGYLSYQINYKPQITKIHKIYVLPDTQGKGIGKKLIQEVEKRAIKEKNKLLILNVNRFNKAVSFYKNMGFSISGSENIDIGKGFLMEDYIMEKEV